LNLLAQLSTYIQGLSTSQQQLFNLISVFANHTSNPSSSSHAPAIKFKEPPMFKGKPDEADGFLFAVQDGIMIQQDAFTSDEE
jgi:hypothetical protein